MRRTIASVALLFFACAAIDAQRKQALPEEVVIFSVQRDGLVYSIDPIVTVHYGARLVGRSPRTVPSLRSPLKAQYTPPEFKRFERMYYRPNTPIAVFSGGEKLGTARVRHSTMEGSEDGCTWYSASVAFDGPKAPMLAASTESKINGHSASRRPATTDEVAQLRSMMQQHLAQYGLDPKLIQDGVMTPVVSTELRIGAGRALIGRFDVTSDLTVHQLFAIAEQVSGEYRLTLKHLVQRDPGDSKDLSETTYVDQLDIDVDGTDEVITEAQHYESWSYTVWRFEPRHQVWHSSFSGGGGGC